MDSNPNSARIIKELLENDSFIETMLEPTAQSEAYWERLIDEAVIDRESYEQARSFILTLNQFDTPDISDHTLEQLWSRIQTTNHSNTKSRKRNILLRIGGSVAAASIIIALTLIGLQHNLSSDSSKLNGINIAQLELAPMTNQINLITAQQELTLPGNEATIDYSSGDLKVNAKTIRQEKTQEQTFNQLVVPPGKRSQIILPDGSNLWVNACTRVIYPSVFNKDSREIFVDGEVYAQISKNTESPFIVRTRNMNIRVLGTQFNVSAYEDDPYQSVVLVEGQVEVAIQHGKSEKLSPNQMFSTDGQRQCVEDVSVDQYISWRDGCYIFKQERISNILTRLSRYSGVEILCPVDVGTLTCSGRLILREDIDQILNGLCKTAPIGYHKENNTYIFYLKP